MTKSNYNKVKKLNERDYYDLLFDHKELGRLVDSGIDYTSAYQTCLVQALKRACTILVTQDNTISMLSTGGNFSFLADEPDLYDDYKDSHPIPEGGC
jgi:hypothetical protein